VQVQTISFFSHLRAKEVYGPFLIIGPLSTLRNWVAEVRAAGSSICTLQQHATSVSVLAMAVAVFAANLECCMVSQQVWRHPCCQLLCEQALPLQLTCNGMC
jgi:hypothetical protein